MTTHRALNHVGRSKLPFAIVAFTLASSLRAAYADPPDGSGATAADANGAELALELEPTVAGLAAADIRSAIELELGLPTVTATPSRSAVLSIRAIGEHRVAMTFRQANGRRVERELQLPDERERALEMIGLLSVNLVRNEAAELVAAMLNKSRSPPPPAPPFAAPVAAPVVPPPPEPPPCKRRDGYHFVHFGADVAPFVGSSRWEPERTVRRFSLELAGGYSEGVHGIGASPLVHTTSKFFCGAQLASIGNVVGGPVEGAQLSGVFNYADDVRGAQLSGVVNVSRDVSGVQSGLVNVARGNVHGVQIGLVNYADDSDFSLGLVNIMRKGRVGVDGFAADSGFFSLALKNGGTHWHSFYGVSYYHGDAMSVTNSRYGLLFGLGAHITTSRRFFFVDIDGLGIALGNAGGSFPDRTGGGWLAQFRAVLGIRPLPVLSIYAGPTYNAYVTENVGSEPPTHSRFVSTFENRSFSYSQWPGFTVGLQLMSSN